VIIMETIKIKDWKDLPVNYTGIIEYVFGTTCYYLNGKLHREDGPAVIYPNGIIEYFLNGKNITIEVEEWIEENNIPKVWTNSHKILFKLTFG